MNKITITGRQEPEGLPEASIGINIQFHFSDDAPPTLVHAIGISVAEILTRWGREDELGKIARECEEIAARRQRQADHAAETLLSRPAAPRESSRARKPRRGSLKAEIAAQKCYHCEEPYGRRDVAGCAQCQAVRVLIGSEEPEP